MSHAEKLEADGPQAIHLGQPARDHIILRDQKYREAMERGSRALLYAIEDHYVARAQNKPPRAA